MKFAKNLVQMIEKTMCQDKERPDKSQGIFDFGKNIPS